MDPAEQFDGVVVVALEVACVDGLVVRGSVPSW
jgi:hypothetical protein